MLRLALTMLVAGTACAGYAGAETPLERGTYLMGSIVACGNCHTPQTPQGPVAGMELAGGTPFREGFGAANSANITPDIETGIGGWTDAQIATAIREGKRPDGSTIGPPMPIALYRGMSDDDVAAIIAYLRQVKPVKNKVAKSEYKITLPPAYGPPVSHVAAPDRTNKMEYGHYLASALGHCIECHSTPGPRGPDFINMTGAGGLEFHGPWGVSIAANITPAGIGNWSDEAVKTAVTTGIRPDGAHLKPPMPVYYYKNVAAADLDAIILYLRQLAPK